MPRYQPHGSSDRVRDLTDLRLGELEIVVCLMAARVCGLPPKTGEQVEAVIGRRANAEMATLERRLWVERCGKVPGTRHWKWRVTRRAFERLGFKDWEPQRFSDSELEQVMAGLKVAS